MIAGIAWGLTSIGLALTWWYGGLQVLQNNMSVGTLVTFTGLVMFVYSPIRRFADVMRTYNKSLVSMERIQEILDLPSSVIESQNAKPLIVSNGSIQFNKVSFAYQKLPVLSNVSLDLKDHSLIAIIGKSGSGKSSFLRLIPRLYDPTEGEILIDGQNIKNVTIESLRSQISVVTQNPMIFSGTIYENVSLGNPNATMEEIENACVMADALDFIMDLEDNFQTVLGQGGITLSRGQAQRITIARALLGKPRILLLDEPSSALDSNSESILISNLNKLKNSMTILFIVHNLELIKNVDQIIMAYDGKIEDVGSYDQLCSSPLYKTIHVNQEKNDSRSN
jgi:ABC-type multidrug transport system fused ATPase/permease subunit